MLEHLEAEGVDRYAGITQVFGNSFGRTVQLAGDNDDLMSLVPFGFVEYDSEALFECSRQIDSMAVSVVYRGNLGRSESLHP